MRKFRQGEDTPPKEYFLTETSDSRFQILDFNLMLGTYLVYFCRTNFLFQYSSYLIDVSNLVG